MNAPAGPKLAILDGFALVHRAYFAQYNAGLSVRQTAAAMRVEVALVVWGSRPTGSACMPTRSTPPGRPSPSRTAAAPCSA